MYQRKTNDKLISNTNLKIKVIKLNQILNKVFGNVIIHFQKINKKRWKCDE